MQLLLRRTLHRSEHASALCKRTTIAVAPTNQVAQRSYKRVEEYKRKLNRFLRRITLPGNRPAFLAIDLALFLTARRQVPHRANYGRFP